MVEPKNIPVVFSCDENYNMPLCVSLLSLLKKAKKTTFYEVFVLLEKDFSEKSKEKILSLRGKYPNCSITFCQLGSDFDQAYVSVHITKAAYYRLKIASILPNISKCLYMDCDILVLNDLTELFDTDLENNVLAGVRPASVDQEAQISRGFKESSCYINSGVMLLDLEKIRRENLEERFLTLAKHKYQFHDQDIINFACEGKIKRLDLKFNIPTVYIMQKGEQVKHKAALEKNYTKEEIQYALKNKVVLHFLGTIKPWNLRDMFYGEVWWMYHDEVEKLLA